MIIAFYYAAENFYEGASISKRLRRLLLPHIGWTVLYSIFYLTYNRQGGSLLRIVIKGVLQLVFGHTLNATMWFQVNLIALTVFVWAICKKAKERLMIWLLGLSVLSMVLQYTGINAAVVSRLPTWSSYPVGRLCEMLPHATLGLILWRYQIPVKVKAYMQRLNLGVSLGIGAWVICLLICTFQYIPSGVGFGYNGLGLIIVALVCVLYFFAVPVPPVLQRGTAYVASMTMGIYCMHRMVGIVLERMLSASLLGQGFVECILIFGGSLMICMILDRLAGKWGKLLVR